ncbi:hypothetical protein D9758_002829 [Tetrapyrgos nigripes]|uniref:WD40 repeat-like protein n=1 Tax=Tetrapyrgos nigripes TaxID=182062 RepID=A0A8H5GPT8_9AGAR|nr:hypothetical protein D9758_002829 [Tetrapyrgos nigripes]
MNHVLSELGDSERRPSRRETVMTLVEMLLQTDKEIQVNNNLPDFEDDKDVPTVDEAHQNAGAEAFNKFQRHCSNLDKELRNFSNATRQLGSSAAILSSAFHLRTHLAQISFLFQQNAANLFPRKIRQATFTSVNHSSRTLSNVSVKRRTMPTPVVSENLDLEHFPEQFEQLACEIRTFANSLNEFPEFTDEAVNASLSAFEDDLKYWASQFRYPAVQRYIQDLTAEMGEHIESITDTIQIFIEIGVPTIRFAQQHAAENLQNLSTVATFFSAVTATGLQSSYSKLDGFKANLVNAFWFSSLVFSIAAAVNSLLGLTWKQAMYRSPSHRVPWWVLIWIKRSPLFFLVISVACFSMGLCLFTYTSSQHRITSLVTTLMTGVTSFGLIAVSAWFTLERWAWSRHRGKKWLGDVLDDFGAELRRITGISRIGRGLAWLCHNKDTEKADEPPNWLPVTDPRLQAEDPFRSMPSSPLPPSSTPPSPMPPSPLFFPSGPPSPVSSSFPLMPPSPISPVFINFSTRHRHTESKTSLFKSSFRPCHNRTSSLALHAFGSITPSNSQDPSQVRPGKLLWQNAIRTIKARSQVTMKLAEIDARLASRRSPTGSSSRTASSDRSRGPELVKVVPSRVAALKPQLKCLEVTQDLAAHQALVRHLQFSPDGKFLATSSWDRLSVIFRVEDPFVSHRVLAHATGFVGQVAWSPDGQFLLTKLVRGIKVWNLDGVCTRTIDRLTSDPVEAVTWLPKGDAFLSVEGNSVFKLDLQGKILARYNFGNMKVRDVACTPDGKRLLGVGPMLLSPGGLRPSKSKVERRLVVYNMETGLIENVTPVLNDVRNITLARNTRHGVAALVSYENKAPPQYWKMEIVKDLKNENQMVPKLTLRHTYMHKTPIDFAGPSYFGGKNDELVLCAGKNREIHIWDRESGSLLHHIRDQNPGGDLTCIAWNPAAEDPFMLATGSHDGAVQVWSKLSEMYDHSAPPSNRGSMLDGTRFSSPFELEDLPRTSSPVQGIEELEMAA